MKPDIDRSIRSRSPDDVMSADIDQRSEAENASPMDSTRPAEKRISEQRPVSITTGNDGKE
jgi:hypothetical protein